MLFKIIKQDFVSYSGESRLIETVSKDNPHIINKKKENDKSTDIEDDATEESMTEEAEEMALFEKEFEGRIKQKIALEDEIVALEEQCQTLREQAETILVEAENRRDAYYDDVYQTATQEAKEQSALDLDDLKKSLIKSHQEDYQAELERLEPEIADIIEKLVIKLVGRQACSQGTILHLVKMGIEEIQLQGDMVIHVSEEDFDIVFANKQQLSSEISEKLSVEVLKDTKLKKNDCLIETIMGTINCGLGVQMEDLKNELELIRESLMDIEARTNQQSMTKENKTDDGEA